MSTTAPEAVQEKNDKKIVKIGDYVVTGKIGQGGIAEIYRARQESLDRDVAIKILSINLTTDPDIVRRFERESIVVARLNHPNIVHVIDKGKAAGRYYFVMEFVDGTSLRPIIDSPQVQVTTKLEMVVQVCKALDYAHKNGVIHRDIKPTNILVDRQGNALVADFGIAQIVGTPEGEMTASDVVMGTVSYMSPEQKISSTNVDQTTDIYALGIILYEILTGKKPLGHFKPPSELNTNVSKAFDPIVLRCLAQEPKDRYQTAVELKDAILEIIGGTSHRTDSDTFSQDSGDSASFLGKCRYLDTIKESSYGSTILVENKMNKKLYVLKKHNKGEYGRKEAKLLSTLKHKHIINIFGSGGDNKSTVIISEYAQGGSLADRMVRKHDWQKGLGIIYDVVSGLDFAHKNNIVHGNLRPSNVLFNSDECVKITDFGMPIHYDNPQKKNWYSAPERKVSKQGDIYAVGVVLHQMIVGRNPAYDSGNYLIVDDFKNEFPEMISRMLSKLLAIRVASRYQSSQEILLDLDEFRRQQELSNRPRPQVLAAPVQESKQMPVWGYLLIGVMFTLSVIAGLYFSGVLK
ncbi:MAG: protein kinase [Candidatus Zixiibacteriota bacterium]